MVFFKMYLLFIYIDIKLYMFNLINIIIFYHYIANSKIITQQKNQPIKKHEKK